MTPRTVSGKEANVPAIGLAASSQVKVNAWSNLGEGPSYTPGGCGVRACMLVLRELENTSTFQQQQPRATQTHRAHTSSPLRSQLRRLREVKCCASAAGCERRG